MSRDPKTPEEWAAAVDAAAFCRAIYDCELYGLITGPAIDAERCDEILERGARLGHRPQPFKVLLKEFLEAGQKAGRR
jgi:hypothetical protein